MIWYQYLGDNSVLTMSMSSYFRSTRLILLLLLLVVNPQQIKCFSPLLKVSNSESPTTNLLQMSATSQEDVKNSILVVGSANQDLTSTSGIIPKMGETVLGNDFATACGGKGANQAVAAAALGLAPVSMVCRVGDDIFGQNLLANFRKCKKCPVAYVNASSKQ
jgi:hypothetical protein